MSNQNITTDLLVELSAEEQQLLSGGCDNYQPLRRRRGGVRQKVVFRPVINIYPSEVKSTDESDSNQTSSDDEDQN
ncbi:MAG: hypothetical protein ACKPFD_11815 [Dolichospermum sp.]